MFTLGVPTLNRYDLLAELIASCEAGTRKPDKYFIVDNGTKLAITSLPESARDRVHIHNPQKNIGVASSCNLIHKACGDITMIAGDDTLMNADTVEQMEKHALETDALFLFPYGGNQHKFACSIQKAELFAKIGYYDERFFPCYFEDNDFAYRMIMAKIPMVAVPNIGYAHRTSSTIAKFNEKEMKQHHINFEKNKAYYAEKWGGQPHFEKYTKPFGK